MKVFDILSSGLTPCGQRGHSLGTRDCAERLEAR